ncbi:MAG TPA: response regulator [Bacteroidales bacterium]|nr:response regulator [Bacteroidales bacterium]
MNIISFIKDFLNLELENGESEKNSKIQFFYKLCWLGVLLLPPLFITDLVLERYIISSTMFITFLLLILAIYLIKADIWKDLYLHILTVCVTAIICFLITVNTDDQTGYIWSIGYPFLAMLLYGIRRGGIIAAVFLVVCMLLSLVPFEWNMLYFSPIVFKIKMLIFYSAMYLISYVYLYYIRLQDEGNTKTIDQLKNDLKSKEDFISKLSHQIRTPLNNIMVTSNLFNSATIDEQQKDLIETIMASTNNLVNIVNNISKVSAIDLDQRDAKIDFNLYSTLNNTIKLFQSLNNNRVSISLKPRAKLNYNLIGDPVKLKQIFLNIIENIIRNSLDESINIVISYSIIKENEKNCELSFRIEADIKLNLNWAKIDTMGGYNVPTDTAQDEDQYYFDFTIAKKIIEHSGSQILVDTLSNTTVFSFFLIFNISTAEITRQEIITETKAEPEPFDKKEPRKVSVNLKDANILLVEDNLINQKIVILSIQKLVKNVDIANNGKEALDKFGTSKYDLILMDIQMPVMDGILATKKIREIEASTNEYTPIMAITANALAGDKENCLAAGMNDYLSKPFQPETLIQKMKSLITSY